MIKNLYAVRDRKLGEYSQVVLLQKEMENAYFESFADDVQNPLYRHLEDYDVYKVGEFDTETGAITPMSEFICGCMVFSDFKRRELSIITQTLNYLPQGYFRMSKEQQDVVKDMIMKAANDYAKDYMASDIKNLANEMSCDEDHIVSSNDVVDLSKVDTSIDFDHVTPVDFNEIEG